MISPDFHKLVSTSGAPGAVGPYAQGVMTSHFVFCSGQIALDPGTGQFVHGGIPEQTHRIIKNIKAVLEAAGTDLAHGVKTTVFLTNINDFEPMNKVYAKYFLGSLSGRSTVQVATLPKGVAIKIEAIAVIP